VATQKDAEREEAIAHLRTVLKPGDTIYTVLRKVSSSGMSRQIDVYVIKDNRPWFLTGWVSKACGYSRADQGHGPLRVGGCGMDMGFAVVYDLSRVVFRDGWKCIGEKRRCPANDHNNDYNAFSRAYNEEHDPESKLIHRGDEASYDERSAFATAKSAAWEATEAERWSRTRKHSDPGYALRQQWL
jgi:hypothetical protein